MQRIMPKTVGITADNAAHLKLLVSFFIVINVVEHGQCISENIIVFIAVSQVQPLFMKISFISKILSIPTIVPFAKYVMIIIGITISFAGKPRIKAINITPSSPIIFANGSKNVETYVKMLASPTVIFAINHIIKPAGAATAAALPKTNSVRSKIERTITFPTCGFLYGGNSRVYEEGTPFKIVFDNIFVTAKVASIPNRITKVSKTADRRE